MNKKNISLILILVLLLGLYMYSQKKEQIAKKMNFFNVNTNEIAKIELTSQKDTLVVVKENDEWKLDYPMKADANLDKINEVLEDLFTMKVSELPITENEKRHSVYNVTSEKGTNMKLYNKDGNVLADVIYGVSQSANTGYIRKANSNKVFRIKNMYKYFNPNVVNWRRQKLVYTKFKDLQKISVLNGDKSYEVKNEDKNWVVSFPDTSAVISQTNASFSKLRNGINALRSQKYIENEFDKYEKQFNEADLELLLVEKDGSQNHIKFIKVEKDDKKNVIIAMVNDEKDVLYEMSSNTFNRFAIDPHEFLK